MNDSYIDIASGDEILEHTEAEYVSIYIEILHPLEDVINIPGEAS